VDVGRSWTLREMSYVKDGTDLPYPFDLREGGNHGEHLHPDLEPTTILA
jgi:hypothetical protein